MFDLVCYQAGNGLFGWILGGEGGARDEIGAPVNVMPQAVLRLGWKDRRYGGHLNCRSRSRMENQWSQEVPTSMSVCGMIGKVRSTVFDILDSKDPVSMSYVGSLSELHFCL